MAGGKRAGAGRKKGVPNKFTMELKTAILNAFDKAGGETYLAEVAKKNPAVFCTLLGKVLPLQLTGDPSNPLVVKVVKFAGTSPTQ